MCSQRRREKTLFLKIFLDPSSEPVSLLNPKLVEVSPGHCCLSYP